MKPHSLGKLAAALALSFVLGAQAQEAVRPDVGKPLQAAQEAIRAGTYKVGRATFKFRRGRVSGIAFGR